MLGKTCRIIENPIIRKEGYAQRVIPQLGATPVNCFGQIGMVFDDKYIIVNNLGSFYLDK